MKINDHVRIIDPKHPHYGETGKIHAPAMWDIYYSYGIKQRQDDWVIRLDKEALDFCAREEQMEREK